LHRFKCTCAPWLIHICDLSHSCVWPASLMCVTSTVHICDMTHSCVPRYHWQQQLYKGTSANVHMCHDLVICLPGPVHMWDLPDSYAWVMCVPWFTEMGDLPHVYVRHDLFIYVTWLIDTHWAVIGSNSYRSAQVQMCMCVMTHSYVWHASLICVTDPLIYVPCLIHRCRVVIGSISCATAPLQMHMCAMTDSCVTWLNHMCDMT